MRYNMPRQTGGNIARLKEAISDTGAQWIDLSAPIMEAKRESRVYYSTDTHWTDMGAYAAAEAILQAMGRGSPPAVHTEPMIYSGDLSRMLGLSGVLTEESAALIPADNADSMDYNEHLLEADGGGDSTLLFLRDSFGTAIAPYIVPVYESTQLRWEKPLRATYGADDVLILIAERNIRMYLSETPVCFAPAMDIAVPQSETACEIEAYEDDGVVFIEFRFNEEAATEGYLLIDDEARWASALTDEDGQWNGWYSAAMPLYEVNGDMTLRPFTGAFAADTARQLRELIDLEESGSADEDEDLEWLRQLRALDKTDDGEEEAE